MKIKFEIKTKSEDNLKTKSEDNLHFLIDNMRIPRKVERNEGNKKETTTEAIMSLITIHVSPQIEVDVEVLPMQRR